MVTVSAPGKVHLMGEHAVVYGKPALLAAIDKRLSVSIEPANVTSLEGSEDPSYLQHALHVVQQKYSITTLPPMHITISSLIPAGFHLGSSAAVAVATVGAALYFLKKIWNPSLINQLAYEVEKKQHGSPSGGDNTSVTVGGLVWYRREFEFLKSIWQLPFRLPSSLNYFYLINTGKPHQTTAEMVTYVSSKLKAYSSKMERLFNDNEQQTKKVVLAIKNVDQALLIDALQKGQRTLEGMGVVSSSVQPLIREIEQSGGAAKILGGGGRSGPVGFLLAYQPNRQALTVACEKHKLTVEPVRLGEDGIKLEQKV